MRNLYFLFLFFAPSILVAQISPGYYLVKSNLHAATKDQINFQWIATNNTSADSNFYILENVPEDVKILSISSSSIIGNVETSPALPSAQSSPLTIGPFLIPGDASVTLQVSGIGRGQTVGDTFALLSDSQLSGIKNTSSSVVSIGSGTQTPEGQQVPVVRAAPNISYDNEPIHFQVNLSSPALVKLTLFSVTGERVFNIEEQAGAGNSSLTWNIQNNVGQTVASGLYIYLLNVTGDGINQIFSGKVLVLH